MQYWWNVLGKIVREGLVGGGMSLGVGFEVLKTCALLSWLSLHLYPSSLWVISKCRHSFYSNSMLAQMPAAMLSDMTVMDCTVSPQIDMFF